MNNWKMSLALIFLLSMCWVACKKDDIKISNGPSVLVTFAGQIVGANNQPIAGAEVYAGTQKTTTDANGIFRLPELSLPSRNAILRVEKTGYFEFSRAYIVENESLQNLRIQLLEKQLIHSFLATESTTAQTDGARLNFPANAVAHADGSAYSGVVSVFAQYLDPTAPDLNNYMPGDLRGITTGGEEQTLATYGMIGVELTTPGGEPLNIAPGQEVEISLLIPSEKLSVAPATIPLWHYDNETARWIEDGSAQKVGDRYVGSVQHFSFWNCDDSFPLVQLNGKLYVENNEQPLQSAQVKLTILSNGWTGFGNTDVNGCFGGKIPVGETMLMEVTIHNPCGAELVYTETIGPFQNDVTLPGIIVQPPNLTTIDVAGRLLDCNQQGIGNGYASIEIGGAEYYAFTQADGSFSITAVHCNNGPVVVVGYDLDDLLTSPAANFPNPVSPLQVGDVSVCTALSEFIEIIYDGQSHVFLDNVGMEFSNLRTVIFSEGAGKYVTLDFQNNQQTGTFPIDYFYMNTVADSLSNINLTTTVTQFGPQGQPIIGTINGTLQAPNGQNHSVTGSYRVDF